MWFHREGLLLRDQDGDRAIVEFDIEDLEAPWKARYIEGFCKGAVEDLYDDDGYWTEA